MLARRARGTRYFLDATTRLLVELADGQRDLGQIGRLAGEQLGRTVTVEEVQDRLAPLMGTRALVDADDGFAPVPEARRGLQVVRLTPEAASRMRVAASPIRAGCDGRGSCCRLYDRILISPDDVGRIRAAYGDDLTPGGLTVDSAVRRDRDDQHNDRYALAFADGACVMLEEDGRCGVHRRAGPAAKPDACRAYPLRDVLCEDELAVGLAVECRCVIDFALHGAPLDAEPVRARRAASRVVEAVRAEVPAALGRTMTRADYRGWRSGAVGRLGSVESEEEVAAWAMWEAAMLLGVPAQPPPRVLRRLVPLFDAVADYLAWEAMDTARVYSTADLQRHLFAWAAQAGAAARDAVAAGRRPGAAQVGEWILADQQLHTHGLLRARTLVTGLVGLVVRTWLARAGAGIAAPPQLAPVSNAEYLGRTHGVGDIIDEHAAHIEEALAAGAGR